MIASRKPSKIDTGHFVLRNDRTVRSSDIGIVISGKPIDYSHGVVSSFQTVVRLPNGETHATDAWFEIMLVSGIDEAFKSTAITTVVCSHLWSSSVDGGRTTLSFDQLSGTEWKIEHPKSWPDIDRILRKFRMKVPA